MKSNLILNTDSYKFSHSEQYPPGTTVNYSYFESRGGEYSQTVFFGLQYYLKEYLAKPITADDIDEAEEIVTAHGFKFNKAGWERILNKHNGYLPVRIKAVPEGTVVPTGNVLMTIENLDPELPWVTSYIETILARVWYPSTVATKSWHIKQKIKSYLDISSDNPEAELPFKLHDFGSRGSTSTESAAIGGAAHLINFMGTDTAHALSFIREYYNTNNIAGFSIPASEHSTITSWGRDGELTAFKNMIKQYGSGAMFACVSDSYDIYKATSEYWGGSLKQDVLDMNAVLVVRPDSGDPVSTPIEVVKSLDKSFGSVINGKGFKVLNKVRVIQGDGMSEAQINLLYKELLAQGYAADNVAVGMGGGLLQKVDRDTCKFAYKTSHMIINGDSVDIYKDPVTDPGKTSKRGKLSLIDDNGRLTTVPYNPELDLLKTVWDGNNTIELEYTFEDIRANSNKV